MYLLASKRLEQVNRSIVFVEYCLGTHKNKVGQLPGVTYHFILSSQRVTSVFRYYTSSLIISGLSRDFLLSFGYLFQTDDIFELHATFEGIGSRHLPLMLHPLKNQTKTIKT